MHSLEESVKAVRKAVMEGKEPNTLMLDDGSGICTVGVSLSIVTTEV